MLVVAADGRGSRLGEMSRAHRMPKNEHFSYFAYRTCR